MLARPQYQKGATLLAILTAARAWIPFQDTSHQRHQNLVLFATSSAMPYPRAAVSVAVRCEWEAEAYYLLVQRGKEPNKGRWSFPGGKLELGETAMQGGMRELSEETQFAEQDQLQWYSETIATNDSIILANDGTADVHYLIAVCFAELKHVDTLPNVKAADDAANAQWWRVEDLVNVEVTPGLVERIQRTEFLYQQKVLMC